MLLLILGGLFVYDYQRTADHRLHIIFCDVGQGDGIFIRTPSGADVLIDGGPDKKILDCLSGHMPFWDRSIDSAIITHPHADHYSGIIEVDKRYDLMSYYIEKGSKTPENAPELRGFLAAENSSAKILKNTDRLRIGDNLKLQVLWPPHSLPEQSDPNNQSVVILLSYGEFQALLTGDIDSQILSSIDDKAGDIEVLKVPHHGSRTGLSEENLEVLDPELAVISVGKNSYGHPASSILKLLDSAGLRTLRTDKNGDVEIQTDGKTWQVTSGR